MTFQKMTVLAAALLVSLSSPAIAQGSCSGYACTHVKITALYSDGWVGTSGNEASLTCTADSGALLRIDPAATKADWLFSFLMTAQTTQSDVWIQLNANAGSGPCVVSFAVAPG